MQNSFRIGIAFCFIILTATLFSSPHIISKSIATNNSFSNNNTNNKINDSESLIPMSSDKTHLKIFTSFYPIYDFVKKIGKDKVDISTIVPIGIEPHDFEPTAKQIIEIQKADLIFINGIGFESWISKVINSNIVDLSKNITIEKINSDPNPHIWLDPILVKTLSKTIFDRLVSLDPQNTDYYKENFKEFNNNLELLNSDILMNLTNCSLDDFIAFHDSFGYFAKRYGLTQHPIGGLSPEADVNPQRVSESIRLAEQLGINVIFSEDNIEPRLANTIANEIEGRVLILSPIEMISQEEQSLNKDYFSKMYDNLDNLKIALRCES